MASGEAAAAAPDMDLARLPLVPLGRIARHLSTSDIAALARTCRALRAVAADMAANAHPSGEQLPATVLGARSSRDNNSILSHTGRYVARRSIATTWPSYVTVTDLDVGRRVARIETTAPPPSFWEFAPGSDTLFVVRTSPSEVHVMDVSGDGARARRVLRVPENGPWMLEAINGDATVFVWFHYETHVVVVTRDGRRTQLQVPPGASRIVGRIALSHDTRHATAATDNGQLCLWDTDSGAMLRALAADHMFGATDIAFNNDDSLVVAKTRDVLLIDTATWGTRVMERLHTDGRVLHCMFRGAYVVAVLRPFAAPQSDHLRMSLIHTRTFAMKRIDHIACCPRPSRVPEFLSIASVAFSDDGTRVRMTGYPGSVIEVRTGRLARYLALPRRAVAAAAE